MSRVESALSVYAKKTGVIVLLFAENMIQSIIFSKRAMIIFYYFSHIL